MLEHNITGSVLLDLDYEAFKAMDIKTVGERVRLSVAIKSLRQECYLAASLAARTPTRVSKYVFFFFTALSCAVLILYSSYITISTLPAD